MKGFEGLNDAIAFLKLISNTLGDAIVIVDIDGNIVMLSDEYAKFLKVDSEGVVGESVKDVIENTRMQVVVKSGRKEIAHMQMVNGQNIIATRVPIKINGKIIGAIGKVLFKDPEELNEFNKKVVKMEEELFRYKLVLDLEHIAKYDLDDIITKNPYMIKIKEKIKIIAETSSNVLIQGESGTGKELFAHAIYNNSKRYGKPFVKVNCSAIPYELMESELFGYEEGAFTGARKGGKIGKFEAANGGIIFLDEVGELPLNMQSKLLRVLQEREITKVGSLEEKKIDVRVIAVTNRDLEKMVEQGLFRLDLYYRLNVVNICIPPLRSRRGDIEVLIKHLIKKITKEEDLEVKGIDEDTLSIMNNYNWPGNVRELENTLERAINFLDEDRIIRPEHLPPKILEYTEEDTIYNLKESIKELEKREIEKALLITNGNKLQSAEKLGISRVSLYKKIEEYDL